MEAVVWIVAFAVLLLIEILTLGLTTIWFAGGALAAWCLAMLKASFPLQIVAFLVVSFILLLLTRPIAVKHFNRKCEKTNADSLIGQSAVVTEKLDELHGTGRVLIRGMEWSAKTVDTGITIEKDQIVLVEAIQGVKLIVSKKEDM